MHLLTKDREMLINMDNYSLVVRKFKNKGKYTFNVKAVSDFNYETFITIDSFETVESAEHLISCIAGAIEKCDKLFDCAVISTKTNQCYMKKGGKK